MFIELILVGIFIGTMSGFFGIGGGIILVPLLMAIGVDIKSAIGISIVQMVFSSVFGSYLNYKKGSLDVVMVTTIGIGGFIGALLSGVITSNISEMSLEIIFLSFASFALLRLFFKIKKQKRQKEVNRILLLTIGIPLGAISMAIGVGGSIVLVPILVGFLHVPLKKAISAGLFFVIFSSVAGFISHIKTGPIDYESGITIGLASLVGVYNGVHLKDRVNVTLQRRLLILFYLLIVLYLSWRIF
ncbi:MAG: sulfite exporter TauE/SafE family protein [Epsilonproteobacteria bacterium]|nr:MAG: sulfite exporter TauE/SafE family protein [Campylobacterota bacterium]